MERIGKNIFPYLGDRQISDITASELLEVLRKIEARGSVDQAHRVRGICSLIFRYAIATGRAERDCAADLRGALKQKNRYTTRRDNRTLWNRLKKWNVELFCADEYSVYTETVPDRSQCLYHPAHGLGHQKRASAHYRHHGRKYSLFRGWRSEKQCCVKPVCRGRPPERRKWRKAPFHPETLRKDAQAAGCARRQAMAFCA